MKRAAAVTPSKEADQPHSNQQPQFISDDSNPMSMVFAELKKITSRLDTMDKRLASLEKNESENTILSELRKVKEELLSVKSAQHDGQDEKHQTTPIIVRRSSIIKATRISSESIAAQMYSVQSKNHMSNLIHVNRIISENPLFFTSILSRCPQFNTMLSHIMVNSFGFRVRHIDRTMKMVDWGEKEGKHVGASLATFIRKRKTGDAALDAWRLNYAQLKILFEEVEGFESFMLVFANNLMRDSIYGMVLRVCLGASLSIVDGLTDVYVIGTYYSQGLNSQANTLLSMILLNVASQLSGALIQHKKKGWKDKTKEVLAIIFFMRPAVDAYRVSTNVNDSNAVVDSMLEMMFNKSTELAFESIPGCVLQIIVWLKNSDKAGTYSLLSILISSLTTGFSSAMIR